MGQQCRVCQSPHRAAIDLAILEGRLFQRDLSIKYGIPPSSLSRHMKNHCNGVRQQRAKLAEQNDRPVPPYREWIQHQARLRGVAIPDLLVLSREHDPYYIGSELHRERAEWFAEIWRKHDYTTGVHVRMVHYKCFALQEKWPNGHTYRNEFWDYGMIERCSMAARWLGTVSPDLFEDRRNREKHLFVPNQSHGVAIPDVVLDDWLPWSLPTIHATVSPAWIGIPEPELEGYEPDRFLDHPYHLAIWVEKSTMNDILIPLCEGLGVDLFVATGGQSMTNAVQFLKRVADIGKPARIFYISDHDPAGEHMPVYVARHMEMLRQEFAPDSEILLEPLAVTPEQIERYGLPKMPIKDTVGAKKKFEERHGEGCVELDALEAIVPGELERLVREAVGRYHDPDITDRLEGAQERAQAALEDAWEGVLDVRAEVNELRKKAAKITRPYDVRLATMNKEMQAELEPYKQPMAELQRRAKTKVQDAVDKVELPERPEPQVELPDESNYLFDSRRSYFDQLAAYKARKG